MVVLLGLWLTAPVITLFCLVAWRAHRLDNGADIPATGWVNGAARRWHQFNVRQREEISQKQADKARMAKLDADLAAREALGAAGRLEAEFERYKAGDLSLDDYRDAILNEQQDLRESLELLRSQRSLMDRDEYEDERDRLEEEKDEIRWRLDWVEKRLRDRDLYAAQPEISGSGRWARFEYVDADGVVTNRDVANWEVSGRYVRAFDRKRKDERNFRIDRISKWVSG